MLQIETELVLFALFLALTLPTIGSSFFARLESRFIQLASRRVLCLLVVGISALALRAAVLPLEPIPEPVVHDEFGYLLSADTFAQGRLTNPTHPMWKFFETFSEIQQPTYQCFAQPVQGLILAFGKVIFGHPFWGVWLSLGFMCAAITWMLQGWLPAQWALLGGFLAVLRFGVFGYWANSYWGGAAGAIAGALVLGALPRITYSHRITDVIIMGLGLLLLANTRPYEGFVLALPVAVALFTWLLGKKRPPFRLTLPQVVFPLVLVLGVGMISMGYYNWRLTGSPVRMGYQVERETYAIAPYFLWQSPLPRPKYHHRVMEQMFVGEEFKGYSTGISLVAIVRKAFGGWTFFLGPVLTLPILMLGIILPIDVRWRNISRTVRFLISTFLFSLAGLIAETFFNPHYASPITSLLLALVLLSMRELRSWHWRGRPCGMFLVRAIPIICAIMFTIRVFAVQLQIPRYEFYPAAWHQYTVPSFRDEIINDLQHRPGHHLVIVEYKPDHDPFFEWVYNDADIDNSKIVWAREMSPVEDEPLISYFKERQIWHLEADEKPARLTKYILPGNTGP